MELLLKLDFITFNFAPNPELPTFKYRSMFCTDTNILAITNISNEVYYLCLHQNNSG